MQEEGSVMREYGKVFSRIWESADFRSLSDDGQKLALYLLTCTHGTLIGAFRVPDGYACEDLQWPSERVSKGFDELSRKGFATRCNRSKWVWVVKYLEWNRLENPNQCKAGVKLAGQIPDECGWRSVFMRICGATMGMDVPDAIETVPEGFLNQYQYQEQEQKKNIGAPVAPAPPAPQKLAPKAKASVKGYTAEFERAWAEYPRRPGNSKADAFKAWNARLAEGKTVEAMQAGVAAYASYCEDTGKTGTEYVKQAATFFGPGLHFETTWEVKAPPAKPALQDDAAVITRPSKAAEKTAEMLAREQAAPVTKPTAEQREALLRARQQASGKVFA